MIKIPSVNFRFQMGKWPLTAALAAGLLAGPAVSAQSRYNSHPGNNSVKVDGTSTAHDWEMETTIIGGNVELPAGVEFNATGAVTGAPADKLPVAVKALIPVMQLHSKADHLPDVMDHLMQEHLKADQFGHIDYKLTEMKMKGPAASGKGTEYDTTGDLEIAGKTKPVSFPITLTVLDPKTINIKATVPLKMTDFSVDPPAPNIGAGLMRCGDDIKIIIDWTLKKRT